MTREEPKRPPGRPEVPEQERLVVGSIRLTQAQWDKLAQLGGAEWIREKLNRARVAAGIPEEKK